MAKEEEASREETGCEETGREEIGQKEAGCEVRRLMFRVSQQARQLCC